MGFISWFKGLFKKNISLDGSKSENLIVPHNASKFKFGTALEVEKNFVAVLVYRGKVADVFGEGKYRLQTDNMPILTRLQKLTRKNKRGDLPSHFFADIYFVNTKVFDGITFGAFDSFVIKSKEYKPCEVSVEGKFSMQIFDVVDFVEALLCEFGVLRNSIALDEISNWVSSLVAKKVQKNKPNIEMIGARDSRCFDGVVQFVNDDLSDCGIKILKLDVTGVKLPKKIYKKTTLKYDEVQRKGEPSHNDMPSLPDISQELDASRLQLKDETPRLQLEGDVPQLNCDDKTLTQSADVLFGNQANTVKQASADNHLDNKQASANEHADDDQQLAERQKIISKKLGQGNQQTFFEQTDANQSACVQSDCSQTSEQREIEQIYASAKGGEGETATKTSDDDQTLVDDEFEKEIEKYEIRRMLRKKAMEEPAPSEQIADGQTTIEGASSGNIQGYILPKKPKND